MAYLKGFKTVSYYEQDGQVCSYKSNFRAEEKETSALNAFRPRAARLESSFLEASFLKVYEFWLESH